MANRSSLFALPYPPVDLVAIAIGGCQVILAWTECGAGGLDFRIERADGIASAGLFSEIGRTGNHVTAFRDGSAKPQTAYSYRVHAGNSAGVSSPSNVVEVTTPRIEPDRFTDRE
jgi:hypothetical protein